MKTLLPILFFITSQLFGQLSEIIMFPMQDTTVTHNYSAIVETPDNDIFLFFIEGEKLKFSKSIDAVTWNESTVLINNLSEKQEEQDLAAICSNTGKIIVTYRANEEVVKYVTISSTDNGQTWSEPTLLYTDSLDNSTTSWAVRLFQTDDNKLWFLFKRTFGIEYITSDNDGVTWGNYTQFSFSSKFGSVFTFNNQTMMIYYKYNDMVAYRKSLDGGITWNDEIIIPNIQANQDFFCVKGSDSSIVMVYNDFLNSTYQYKISTDGGLTWSEPELFTKYLGVNKKISLLPESLLAVFTSDRTFNENNFTDEDDKMLLWIGNVEFSEDLITPPVIKYFNIYPTEPLFNDTLKISVYVEDDDSVAQVFLNYKVNTFVQTPVKMLNDNADSYGGVGANNYTVLLSGFAQGDIIRFSVSALDINGNSITRYGESISFPVDNTSTKYYLDINRFKLPLSNSGVLADIKVDTFNYGGYFDEAVVLFSGGFALSGYDNDQLWANANLSASRIEDYQPGIVGFEPIDPQNAIYVVRKEEPPFSDNWQTWKNAVEQGAEFYDGNGDGIYNPIDLNNNGMWDENEDAPYMIGDITTWTVFNDGVPAELRRFVDMTPKQIEIKQTVFAYSPDTYPELDGVIFIKYNIENKSSEPYDSVYFSIMTDPDIGEYVDDLVGCDININSSYGYNKESDGEFGNAPTFMTTLLQGPPTYIAGKTFTDNNGNGIYDDGVDTPLDTAYYLYGGAFESKTFPGAKNKEMTAFSQYMHSHPILGDPDTPTGLRYYQIGGHIHNGDSIYVSTWKYGNGAELGNDTLNIESRFMYSGNPVNNTGWFNTTPLDQRMVLTTGTFTLEPTEPVEIITAYVVGRGNTSLESVDVTKKIANNVIGFYNTNFTYVPVGVRENTTTQLPTEYTLSQNYPNPFNPSTTIKYSVPTNVSREASIVSLKVYDILGREVATLVKKEQKAGNYEVNFDASNLTSGVYFYSLKSGGFIQSKKMILLK